jgi:hypothetical protein
LAKAGEIIAKKAGGMIGKEHEEWPPLAESTGLRSSSAVRLRKRTLGVDNAFHNC